MNESSSIRESKLSRNKALETIAEEVKESSKQDREKKPFEHSYKKAALMVNRLLEEGDDIHETSGECNPYYERIKEGNLF
jgi:hypothetical protein